MSEGAAGGREGRRLGQVDAARLAELAGEPDPRAYEEVVRHLGELDSPPPGLRRKVLARVRREMLKVRRRRVLGLAGLAVAALAALAVIALLPEGGIGGATFIAADPVTGLVFASRPASAGVLLEPDTLRPQAFHAGEMPDYPPRITAVAFGRDGYIYAASPDDGTVRVLDSKGMRGERVLSVGGRPTGLALSAHGELFVRDGATGRVLVVDPVTGAVLTSMPAGRPTPVGAPPGEVISSSNGMLIWVVDPIGARVICFDATRKVVVARDLEGLPSAAALSGDQRFLVVADAARPSLVVVDAASLEVIWQVELEHPAVALASGGGEMVYALESARSLVSIDAASGRVLARYRLMADARALTWTGDRVLVALPDRVYGVPVDRLTGPPGFVPPGALIAQR